MMSVSTCLAVRIGELTPVEQQYCFNRRHNNQTIVSFYFHTLLPFTFCAVCVASASSSAAMWFQ